MNIAFISHASVLNGAPISLAELVDELLGNLPPGELSTGWPVPGPVLDKYDLAGAEKFFYAEDWRGREILVTKPTIKKRLRKKFAEKKIELVIANSLESFRAVQAASKMRIPVIWMIHELVSSYLDRREFPEMRSAARTADRLIFNSRTALSFSSELGEGIKEKSRIIYPGIRLPGTKVDKKSARHELGLDSNEIILASIGDICPQKGVKTLIRAFQVIFRSYPDTRLMIIGRSPPRYRGYYILLKNLCRELGLNKRIVFTGEQMDLSLWLSACDILVHASQSESFGRVIVESLAWEVPVVAVCSEGPKEIIEDRETGLLVPAGDPGAIAEGVIRMLDNYDQSLAMARKGRFCVEERYGIARTAEELKKEIESLQHLKRPK